MKSYLALGALLLAACGSNSSLDQKTPDPKCAYNVETHADNPWLLKEPEVHFDFWGDWSDPSVSGFPDSTESDWANLIYYNNVFQRLSEYGIKQGSLDLIVHMNPGAKNFINDDAGTARLDDTTFVGVINEEIQFNTLPYPSDNTIYVIMLPPHVNTEKMVTHGWAGYHDYGTYGSQKYAYAIISYSGDDTDEIISHEIYEAATDPDVGSGYYDTASGNEVGDLCENKNGNSELLGGYKVQKVWSQDTCSCL